MTINISVSVAYQKASPNFTLFLRFFMDSGLKSIFKTQVLHLYMNVSNFFRTNIKFRVEP